MTTYVCTGLNGSARAPAAPFLSRGAKALALWHPFGGPERNPELHEDCVVKVPDVRSNSNLASVAERKKAYGEPRELSVLKRQQELASELGQPLEVVKTAYWVHAQMKPPPKSVRRHYVFQPLMRRYSVDDHRSMWLNAVVEPVEEQLADVLNPSVNLLLFNSSSWHSRLVYEIGRLAGANVQFLDDPFLMGRYWMSATPLLTPLDFTDPQEDPPTAAELQSLVLGRPIIELAREIKHPLAVQFERARPMKDDASWLKANFAIFRKSSLAMPDDEFAKATQWAPRYAGPEDVFDFGVFGEDPEAPEGHCVSSTAKDSLEACIRLAEAYPAERILYRPHRGTPSIALEPLYRHANVYLSNASDEDLRSRCGEIVSRYATNGLTAELAGREVMWGSNAFYSRFHLQEPEHRDRFASMCRTCFRPADQIAEALLSEGR